MENQNKIPWSLFANKASWSEFLELVKEYGYTIKAEFVDERNLEKYIPRTNHVTYSIIGGSRPVIGALIVFPFETPKKERVVGWWGTRGAFGLWLYLVDAEAIDFDK